MAFFGPLTNADRYLTTGISVSAQNIADEFLTLPLTPAFPNEIFLIPVGGVAQEFGTDFTILNQNQLSWNGLGLETIIALGDRFLVSYLAL